MDETAKAHAASLGSLLMRDQGEAEGRILQNSAGVGTSAAPTAPPAHAVLDALPAQVAVLDRNGVIVAANAAWRQAAGAGAELPMLAVGADYLAAWRLAAARDEVAAEAARGLPAVIRGRSERLALEYPWQCSGEERWVQLVAAPLPDTEGCVVMCHDITDRKRAEARLRVSEGRFRSLVENMPDIVFCRGVKGRSAHGYDEGGARLYGRDVLRIAGTMDAEGRARIDVWYAAVHPEDRERYLAAERRRKEAYKPFSIEYRIIHPVTGELRWMREVAWVVEEVSLGQTFFDSYILDITEEKRRAAALATSEARWRALFDNALDAIFVVDAGGRLADANPAACRLMGWGRAELIGRPLTSLVPAAEAGRMAEAWAAMQHGVPHRGEWTLVRRDGGTVPVEIGVGILPDGRLKIAARDIAERRRAEAALKESDLRLRRIIESDAVGMVVFDLAGRVHEANDAFLELVGRSREEPAQGSLDLLGLTSPEHRHLTAVLLAEAAKAQRQRPFETELLRPDGERVGVLLGVAYLGGSERLCIGLVADLSDRRVAERRRLLLQELNHRVKNILAMVQAIAQQTGRRAATVEGFLAAFRGRLAALSAAHDLLVAHGWQGVRLESLLRKALGAHLVDAKRLTLTLPSLVLRPQAAQDLALAVHELATNATKHGALAEAGGHVTLAGRIENDELVLVWREEGGLPVTPPDHQGFGTALLTQAIRHQHRGRVACDWRSEGLVCTMVLPLATAAEPLQETRGEPAGQAPAAAKPA
ncbi:PAS domain S-box protein [Benzoatithermus flavus]|uniref:histidine kinase n=1 Tax=Benzoatithermus flavus TaxID=3108223 RepID=A0ABU8XU60_9PROT